MHAGSLSCRVCLLQVFARMLRNAGLMEERDYQTYVSLFQNMSNFMKKPNIIVHLDVSPAVPSIPWCMPALGTNMPPTKCFFYGLNI